MKSCYRILLLCIALMLAACTAQIGTRPTAGATLAPEEAVARRAQERWDLLIAKEYGKAYDYLTPGTRTVMDRDVYARKVAAAQVRWHSVEINNVSCEEDDHCTAFVDLKSRVKIPQIGNEMIVPTPVKEQWIRTEDQWYFLPGQ